MDTTTSPSSSSSRSLSMDQPRQMWELDREVEGELAPRSLWIRGKGIGATIEEIQPLLAECGVVQRVRMSRVELRKGDPWGKYLVYVTYSSPEGSEAALLALAGATYNNHRIVAWQATGDGAYRPMPGFIREQKRLEKERKKKIMKNPRYPSSRTQLSADKLREKLKHLERIRTRNQMMGSSPDGTTSGKEESEAVDGHSVNEKKVEPSKRASSSTENESKRRRREEDEGREGNSSSRKTKRTRA